MPERRPNILVLMPDQLRADWIGPGNRGGALTPAIDGLIARGTWLTNTICPSPLCAPSRACLATGYEYARCGVSDDSVSLPAAAPSLYKRLRDHGYSVLTCGKLDLLKGENDWGIDGLHMRDGGSALMALGFTGGIANAGKHAAVAAHRKARPEPYFAYLEAEGLADLHAADFATRKSPSLGEAEIGAQAVGAHYENTAPTSLPEAAYCDNWVARNGLALIAEAGRSGSPWFLQVNFVGPHEPMDVTERMAAATALRNPPLPDDVGGLDAARHRAIRRNYTAIVENIDRILSAYVEHLTATGELDDTVIVLMSDHGEMLGDEGIWEKSVPYQASLRVPLVIAGPGILSGRVHDGPATTLDLHATILELAGIAAPEGIDSRSMRALLCGAAARHRDHVFAGLGAWRLVYDGRRKLIAGYRPGARIDPRATGGAAALGDPSGWRLIDTTRDRREIGAPPDLSSPAVRLLVAGLLANESRRG